MLKYNVYYKNSKIGNLYIKEDKYKYEPEVENIAEIEKKGEVIFIDAKRERDWGEPIAFFDSRIQTCKRFGQEEKITYPNSEYYFIKDNHYRG